MTMGDRGRVVLPVDVHTRAGLSAGAPLVVIETPAGSS
jgi:bifunctional DNA-binding transcriptional regulator/antitoxin component of YhaV-PrlF toxin-antitoxin module